MHAPDSIEDYCEKTSAEYRDWIHAEASHQLRSGWTLAILFFFAALWSWHRSGYTHEATLSYAPALFALLATSAAHTLPSRSRGAADDAVGQHNFVTACIVLGMAHSAALMATSGKTLVNAPIQFILFLSCMLCPAGWFARNVAASMAFVVGAAGFLVVTTGTGFLAQTGIQFVMGTALGLFVNRQLTRARMYRFQSVHMNASHRAHALAELTKLVPPHVVAHIHEGGGLESSMPVGRRMACVLAFDIIGSSRHESRAFALAVESFLSRSHALMMEGYRMEPLQANAFRLKDLGDGFLATVGFPLATPGDRDVCELACELAERFVAIFDEEMRALALPGGIHCAVGVSRGHVEGFFPTAGVKQYELRGHTITLATRYEALRKLIFPVTGTQGNIIILREDVFARLPKRVQEGYREWNTRLPGQAVRDDREATRAYYRFVGATSPVEGLARAS